MRAVSILLLTMLLSCSKESPRALILPTVKTIAEAGNRFEQRGYFQDGAPYSFQGKQFVNYRRVTTRAEYVAIFASLEGENLVTDICIICRHPLSSTLTDKQCSEYFDRTVEDAESLFALELWTDLLDAVAQGKQASDGWVFEFSNPSNVDPNISQMRFIMTSISSHQDTAVQPPPKALSAPAPAPTASNPTAEISPHNRLVYAVYDTMCNLNYTSTEGRPLADVPAYVGHNAINPPDRAPLDVIWKISTLYKHFLLWIWDNKSAPTKSLWDTATDEWTRCAFPSMPKELSIGVAELIDDLFRVTLADCAEKGISKENLPDNTTCKTREFKHVEEGMYGYIYTLSLTRDFDAYAGKIGLNWIQEWVDLDDEHDKHTYFRTLIDLELEPR